ncbi:MAG TPA: SIMPL domain-containing protein [Caldimonas sp.]
MKLLSALAAAGAALAFAAAQPARADTPPPQGVLSLTTSATVEVTKDVLAVTFSTTKDGADANAVQAQLKQALDAALAEAKKAARPGQVDVQTGAFSLFPRYTSKGGITGWQGTAEIIVDGRDMAAIGQLSGRITTMTVARVAYRLSREAGQKVEADVAAEAIARYRAKAGEYAKQFGYASYSIREVNVTTTEPPQGPMPMARAQTAAMSTPGDALSVEPGKAQVNASVSGTVQMK